MRVFETNSSIWFVASRKYLKLHKSVEDYLAEGKFTEFDQCWTHFDKMDENLDGTLTLWNRRCWEGTNPRTITGRGVWRD